MDFSQELNYIWTNYFWSSDKGNGPEAIQQWALVAAAGVALWPVARKILHNEFKRAHTAITGIDHDLEHIIPEFIRKPLRWLKSKVTS